MTESQWHWLNKPEQMWGFVDKTASDRKWRLLATAFCRCIWPMLSTRGETAVEVAERFADGEASEQERADACAAANQDGPHSWSDRIAAMAAGASDLLQFCPQSVATVLKREDADANQPLANILRDIFGNPFRPVSFDPEWRTSTAVTLAQQMYDSRDFNVMPILADALQDAGCGDEAILNHCHYPKGMHVCGCWVVDLVLGKA